MKVSFINGAMAGVIASTLINSPINLGVVIACVAVILVNSIAS